MNDTQRDALLIRLDERSENQEKQLDKADKKQDETLVKLDKQNGKIMKNRIGLIGLACLLVGAGVLQGADIIHILGG